MGDKFSSPSLGYMVEVLAILARGCYTRANVGAAAEAGGDEQLLKMSNEDAEMLYCQAFYAKVIKENINIRATVDLVVHLCWEDEVMSKKIIDTIKQAIHDVDYDGFKPYFDVFGPLLNMQDSKHVSRVDYALNAYISVINANLRYKNATLYTIRFLSDVVLENAEVRKWMFKDLDWLEMWIFDKSSDLVRDQTAILAMNLIPEIPPMGGLQPLMVQPQPQPQPQNQQQRGVFRRDDDDDDGEVVVVSSSSAPEPETKQPLLQPPQLLTIQPQQKPISPQSIQLLYTLFKHLLQLLGSAKAVCRPEPDTKGAINEEGFTKVFWRLTSYCRLLTWCIRGPAERAIFAQFHNEFAALLVHVDTFHLECDENKLELVNFWSHALQGSPENIKWVAKNDRLTSRLLDYFISIRPSEKFRYYNLISLPSFYYIMLMCTEHENFLQKLMFHQNFDWAVKYLYLDTSEYDRVSEMLIQIIKKCASYSADYRTRLLQMVLHQEKIYSNPENVLNLLDNLLQTVDDSATFCERNGLEQLTRFIELRQDRDLETEDYYQIIIPCLDVLIKATEWMVSSDSKQEKHKILATDIQASWDSKHSLLSAALSLMDHFPAYERLVTQCHKMVEILCSLDAACLDASLNFLNEQFVSRDAMQTTRFASHPAGLVHDENPSPESLYYGFVLRFIQTVLGANHKEQVVIAIDLAVLVGKEILYMQRGNTIFIDLVVPVLRQIWDHPQHGLLLRENRRLGLFVAHSLASGLQCLDSSEAFLDLINTIFPHAVSTLPANHREAIIRNLTEKLRFSIMYINQNTHHSPESFQYPTESSTAHRERYLISIIQLLKALSILLSDADVSTQFMQEYTHLISPLRDMAAAVEAGNSPLVGLNRVQEFVKLVAALPK